MTGELVPVGPLQEAYLQAIDRGESANVIAQRMGWVNPDGKGDLRRLKRTLGLVPMGRGYTNKCMAYHNAVKLAKALGLDPVDAGV